MNLANLPVELISLKLLPYLSPVDVYHLSLTSKKINTIIDIHLHHYLKQLPNKKLTINHLLLDEFYDCSIIKKVLYKKIIERFIGNDDSPTGYDLFKLTIIGKVYLINNQFQIYGPLSLTIKSYWKFLILEANFKVLSLINQQLDGSYVIRAMDKEEKNLITSLETIICNFNYPFTLIVGLGNSNNINQHISFTKEDGKYAYKYDFYPKKFDLYNIFPFLKIGGDWDEKIKHVIEQLKPTHQLLQPSFLTKYIKINNTHWSLLEKYEYKNQQYIILSQNFGLQVFS